MVLSMHFISTAPSNKEPSCPETLKCMLKCKDGYFLGDKQSNGCPYCRCLKPHESEGHSGSSHGHSSGDSQTSNGQNPKNGWNLQGQMKDNSGSSPWTGSGSNHWTGSGTGGKVSGSGSSGSSSILQSKHSEYISRNNVLRAQNVQLCRLSSYYRTRRF